MNKIRVGWVTYESLHSGVYFLWQLNQSGSEIRAKNISKWLNKSVNFKCSIYRKYGKYDIVVFVKVMDAKAQEIVRRLKSQGTITVFDANVNFYEVWGEYISASNIASMRQVKDAYWMTTNTDYVIADSSHIKNVINVFRKDNVLHIPDNVDTRMYNSLVEHKNKDCYQIIWSGMSEKSFHLMLIAKVLKNLAKTIPFQLVLVSEKKPAAMDSLQKVCDVRYIKFNHRSYVKELMKSDIIISPKFLNNSYDLGHSEYKITLGMAMGLPAVASPQQSYIEACDYLGGGIIARSDSEWQSAISGLLADVKRRRIMGRNAYNTVRRKYSIDVVGAVYGNFFTKVINGKI